MVNNYNSIKTTPASTMDRYLSKTSKAIFKVILMLLFIHFSMNAKATVWGQGDFSVSYDECTGTPTIKLLAYFDDCGTCDADYLSHAEYFFKDDNNDWVQFAHTGNYSGCSGTTSGDNGYAISSTTSGSCNGSKYIEVTLLQLPNNVLDNSTVFLRVTGKALDDATPDTVFDWDKSASIPSVPNPTGLTASSDDCLGVNLSWSYPSSIPSCLQNSDSKILIYRNNNDHIATISYPTATYKDPNGTAGTAYNYKIFLRYEFPGVEYKDGSFTSNVSGTKKAVPGFPPNLVASNGNCDGTIDLTWDWNAISPDNFRFKRGNTYLTPISGNLRSFKDDDPSLVRGQSYSYAIEAKNNCGWSPTSPSVTGVSPIDPSKPSSAGFMATTNQVNGTVTLTWTATAGATGYEIERSLLGGGGSSFFPISGANTLTYVDNSLKACETYEYRLRSTNNCVPNGILCDNFHTVQLEPILNNVFDPATSLIVSKGFFPNRVEVSWSELNPSNFINYYKIFRKVLGSVDDSTIVVTLPAGSNFFIDNYSDAGVLYKYTVLAQSQCDGTIVSSNVANAVGFRSPFGTVTGKVSYGGGIAVEGVRVSAESTNGVFGRSLIFNGTGNLKIEDANSLDASGGLLLEAWIKPSSYAANFTLFEKAGSYSLKYSSGNYQFTVFNNPSGSYTVSVPATEVMLDNFSHVAAQLKNGNIELFVNGIKKASQAAAGVDIKDNAADLLIGAGYHGILDEVRVWGIGKSESDMQNDYSRLMSGGEVGLRVYLRADEGVGSYAYDISKAGVQYNRNHAFFVGNIQWSIQPNDIPSSSQLGVIAYTDQNGDYILSIPYHAGGEVFVIQPSYLVHEFDPSSSPLYLGDGAAVHVGINFLDKSSFIVTGAVNYDNPSTCPVKDAILKVDGEVVIAGGLPVKTNASGAFEIEVPIGEHVITVEQAGHVYSVGRFPATGLHDFQEDLAMPSGFKDATLVKVVGRVVGGLREAKKIPGLGKSSNNIGVATVSLATINGCSSYTVNTDPATGEYTLYVPPLKYVPDVTVSSNPAVKIYFQNQGLFDFVDLTGSSSTKIEYDTTFDSNGGVVNIVPIEYGEELNYIYRKNPEIAVFNDQKLPFIGDETYAYTDANGDPQVQDLRLNPFKWPVLHQQADGFKYTCNITVFEKYTNNTTSVTDSVPTSDGTLHFLNNLGYEAFLQGVPAAKVKLSDINKGDTLNILRYKFSPGFPSFSPDAANSNYDYTQTFTVKLVTSSGVDLLWKPVDINGNITTGGGQDIFRAYMLGKRSVGDQIVTEGPTLPEYVLRDPPGSGSFASRESGTTKTETTSWGWKLGGGASTSDQILLGTKIFSGIGVATETNVEANVQNGFKAEVSGGNQGSQSVTTTNTKSWSTSSGTNIAPGANSDLYVAKTKNITAGISEELVIIPNSQRGPTEPLGAVSGAGSGFSFGKKYGFSVVPKGYQTQILVQEYDIKNLIIPRLITARNAYLSARTGTLYSNVLPTTDPNYGKNNDDPDFTNPSTPTPNTGEYADWSGPSYTYEGSEAMVLAKIAAGDVQGLQDLLDKDSVRYFNNQIKKWQEAIRLNEWEKINIDDQTVIDSLEQVELDKLDDEYAASEAAYIAASTVNGVGGAIVIYGLIANPLPGTAVSGYATFAVTAGANIATAELAEEHETYLAKKERIEKKFEQMGVSDNKTITGDFSITESMTHESAVNYTRSVEFGMHAQTVISAKSTVSNNGVGIEKGLELNYSSSRNWGRDTSETETVSYTLSANTGDLISVDVYPSLLGWGPIFKTRAGSQTSCPHEEAILTQYYHPGDTISPTTLQVEKPTISASIDFISNIPSNEAAVFNLTLNNQSEVGYTQAYDLRTISATNLHGAIVRFDGVYSQAVELPYDLNVNKVVTIEMGPGSTVYEHDSILVVLASQCQYTAGTGFNTDIADSIYLSAHFIPTCTDVELVTPEDQWVLNNSFNNTMPVIIGGYNFNTPELEYLELEFKPSENPNWIGLQSFLKDTSGMNDPSLKPIPPGELFTLYDWMADQVSYPDGEYDLRVTSECAQAGKVSVTHSGVIDRIDPHAFGTPSPGDGILSPNDDISIKFNEPIYLGAINPTFNFDIRGVTNGTEVMHGTSLYFDGVDDYVEVTGGLPLQRRDFTIEFSFRRSRTGKEMLLSQGSDLGERLLIGFDTQDHLIFRINTQQVATTATFTDNDWHYFAVSYDYDNETAELFVADGATAYVANVGYTAIFSDYMGDGPLRLGMNTVGGTNHFQGNIHGLRVWNTARTLNEFSLYKSRLLSGTELGLLYNWRMDEATGNLAEEHIRRRDATIVGPIWEVSPNGSSASFDGSDDYLKVSTGDVNITPGMDFTLEFWFNSSQPGPATLFSNGTGTGLGSDALLSWNIEKGADGKVHVRHNGLDFVATNNNYFDGAWHHFALVLQRSGNLSAYVDGNPENSTQALPFGQLGGSHMYLGAHGYTVAQTETVNNFFAGGLDEFRFWDLARKSSQIERDKQHRMNGDEPGLRLYLPFENYVPDPTGVPILTPTFNEQIAGAQHTVANPNGATLGSQTPTIKLQRPVQAIAFSWSLNGDQIILTPTTSQEIIENVTLDITVKGLRDLHGNTMESPVTWIAYMDKNQVVWQDDLLVFSKLKGEALSFTSGILNKGGAAKAYDILGMPDWLTVSPQSGAIGPNSSQAVTFTVDPDLNVGDYTYDISLLTDFGFPEKLSIQLGVEGLKPSWSVDPAGFGQSMAIIGRLKVNNVISRDGRDILAALVGTEVRGVAQLEYVPGTDSYMVFMDVYGHPVGANVPAQPLDFYIWDASTGTVFTVDGITPAPGITGFVPDTLAGTVSAPKVFAAGGEVSFEVALGIGWNWLGFPLQPEFPTDIDGILETVGATDGDEVKTVYAALFKSYGAEYYKSAAKWVGTLSQIGPPDPTPGIEPEQLYKLRTSGAIPGPLTMRGTVVDPTARPITLVNGWNWIGFISVRNQPVAQALGNLSPAGGDLIKGRSQFATYDASLGWVGSLKTLRPGQGFMYRSGGAAPKTFTYPLAGMFSNLHDDPEAGVFRLVGGGISPATAAQWAVKEEGANTNMTLLGAFRDNCGLGLANGNFAVGAFDGTGTARAVAPIEALDGREVFYLTVAGLEGAGERLGLRLLNTGNDAVTDLGTSLGYVADQHLGGVDNPFEIEISEEVCLQLKPAGTVTSLTAFPTVFKNGFTLAYQADNRDENATVTLTDLWGRAVFTAVWGLVEGPNERWFGLPGNGLAAGLYTVELRTAGKAEGLKLVKTN